MLPRTSSYVSPVNEVLPAVLFDRVLPHERSCWCFRSRFLLAGVSKVLPSLDADGPGVFCLGSRESDPRQVVVKKTGCGHLSTSECLAGRWPFLFLQYEVLASRVALLRNAILLYLARHSPRVLPRSDSLFGSQMSDLLYQASEHASGSAVSCSGPTLPCQGS